MEQLQKHHSERPTVAESEPEVSAKTDPEVEAHKQHSDELLDEIDTLLEENAEAFVAAFVQKGGQ